MKFTDRSLKALKPKEKRYEVSELNGHGFGIRVLPSGKKTFIYRYKLNGKTRGMMLGSYEPGTKYGSLAEAHKRHANARAKLKEGVDPGAIKQAKIQAEREADTVDDLAERYVELHAKKQKKTWQEDKRMLDKDVLPAWGSRKAKDIHRRDVNALMDNIVARGAPVVANRTLEVIRRMFNFAIERDIIDNNPCYLVKAPGKETKRDRVLSPAEIRFFWRRLYKTDMGQLVRLALKLQLVTAQRRGEVMNAKWCDIDLDGGWWTIPETKNQLSHRVALSPIAKALIRHIHRRSSDTDWLFPNPSRDAAMTERAPTRAVARNLEKLGIAHFTPHDLRRTAASQMASAGVQRLVISKVLNHVESGITAVYDRHGYDAEKKLAMNVWADRLIKTVTGNVND